MRAWAVVENGKPLQEIELPTPEPKGTEVLMETTYCGVCHSDLHIWEGYYDIGGGKKMSLKDRGVVLPLAMGHEIVGRVVKLGPDAKGVKVGDIRIVYPWVGCGTWQGLADEDNMCLTPRSIGVYQMAAMGRMWSRRTRAIWSIRARRSGGCGHLRLLRRHRLSAIKKVMPVSPEEAIVVIGAGGLGMNAIAVLRALGHQNIVVVDVSAEKRGAATRAGAHKTIDGTGEV